MLDGLLIKMTNALFKFWEEIEKSSSYIKMGDLKNSHSYKIWARNAYVGIWVKSEKGFMISRYKVGKNPYLFVEYHWDTGIPYGTVKPLELIEKCPLELKENLEGSEKQEMLKYLDNLEEKNPPINGVNTVLDRKIGAIRFKQRLEGKINWRDVDI